MPKQHFEGFISKELSRHQFGVWYQKNMVMPLAHHQSVGDFIILTEKNNYVLECKECKDNRFSLDRLTQLNDLQIFENKLPSRNISLIGLLFWKGRLDKSSIYIIPLKSYLSRLINWPKQSLREDEVEKIFTEYKLQKIDFRTWNIN